MAAILGRFPGQLSGRYRSGKMPPKPIEVKARRQRATAVIEGRNLDHEFRKEWKSAFSKVKEDHKYLELYINNFRSSLERSPEWKGKWHDEKR